MVYMEADREDKNLVKHLALLRFMYEEVGCVCIQHQVPLYNHADFRHPDKNAVWHFVRFLVTELHSKEGEAPKRGLWVVRSTGPPSSPIRLVPRPMAGGSVDTAVTSPCPLHNGVISRALFVQDPHGGRYFKRL